jgi:glycosyltransferase involved in cell wall biosynthesis
MSKLSKKPAVSVIIPTYNRGWVLKEAIDSVLAQEFSDYELIVVDDGSTDDTRVILDSYGRDIIVLPQANQGVSAARNRGIAESRAQLVAFLDSDDLWLPQKLTRQVSFFKSNPAALIGQTEETWVRNGVRVNPKKRHQKLSGMIFEPSLDLCLVSPSAVMIRKSLFDTVGVFDESLPACEDYDLWLRVSCRYPVWLIDESLIIKRGGHADQLSKAAGLDKYRIQSLTKLIDSGQLSESQTQAAVRTLKHKCAIFANGCRKRDRESEAKYYEALALKFQKTENRRRRTEGRRRATESRTQKRIESEF